MLKFLKAEHETLIKVTKLYGCCLMTNLIQLIIFNN